ncbi:hypothetical protein [Oceanobacillus bengalensis]|uniref:Uncharacterized protein n=1 Tax=Oceanobacillus bengalensis TaxID=1435466 RepID=A0A494YRE4_9BACI|nr:hypothetical protein [Oceanobacillus bengalensis]RKQ11766.1 hypothetical protein D8M05_19310 [Oceanobacillus bengalensis]
MTMNNDKSNIGYTLFKPTGVKHEYLSVDLQNKLVTATVSYNDRVYLTVFVNLKTDTVTVDGSIEELQGISMDKESYIKMFRREAEFFVANNISNPKKYYEQYK